MWVRRDGSGACARRWVIPAGRTDLEVMREVARREARKLGVLVLPPVAEGEGRWRELVWGRVRGAMFASWGWWWWW